MVKIIKTPWYMKGINTILLNHTEVVMNDMELTTIKAKAYHNAGKMTIAKIGPAPKGNDDKYYMKFTPIYLFNRTILYIKYFFTKKA